MLVALIAAFAAILPADTFVSTFNAQTIAGDASIVLILAAGATLVIISGGLDLSIGSVMTFAAVASALAMKEVAGESGEHALAAALAGIGVGRRSPGRAWGAINGALIAFARLPPFVVTLGSLGAALGAARLLSGGANVSGTPPELQEHVGLATVAGVPVPFLVAVVPRARVRLPAGADPLRRAQLPDRLQRGGRPPRRHRHPAPPVPALRPVGCARRLRRPASRWRASRSPACRPATRPS